MEQQTLTEITTLTISKLISVIQNKYFITGAILLVVALFINMSHQNHLALYLTKKQIFNC